jgi:hypothetical protein
MQKSYPRVFARAVPGQLEGFGSAGIRTLKNSALDVIWTNTVTTPASVDASTTYSLQFSGGDLLAPVGMQYITTGSPTQAALNAGLLGAARSSDVFDHFLPTLAGNVVSFKARRSKQDYTIASASNASTTNDLTIGTATPSAQSTAIDFGRFVVRSLATDSFNEARLPSSNSGVQVMGVTLAPRVLAVKNAIGPNARAMYYQNEAMDVVNRSNDATGIWVESDPGIVAATALNAIFIDCNTAGKLGQLTLVSTNNLALPAGVSIVEGSTPTPNLGQNVTLVALNLP